MRYIKKKKTDTRTCSNRYRLNKYRFRKEIDDNWFKISIVDEWNKLSRRVINTNTIKCLKWKLDRFKDGEGY